MKKIVYYVFTVYFRTIARFLIWRDKPIVVTITGSVGKTTTKDLLVAQLSPVTSVRGTLRSQNSELTTPLSILGLELQNRERSIAVWGSLVIGALGVLTKKLPNVLVLEVGAGHPGDIIKTASWLKSDVVIYTALAEKPVHVEFFESREALFQEKKDLALYAKKSALILYPKSDPFLKDLLADLEQEKFEFEGGVVSDVEFTTQGTTCKVGDNTILLEGVWSEVLVYAFAMNLEMVRYLGMDPVVSSQEYAQYFTPTPGRGRLLRGINKSVVVDDSYNASPVAVKALLGLLAKLETKGRKIVLFGDMKELGSLSESAHREVAHQVVPVAQVLVTVGEESLITHQEALKQGMNKERVKHFDTSREAGSWLREELQEGDVVVAKSSRHAIQMERALELLVLESERGNLVQEYL